MVYAADLSDPPECFLTIAFNEEVSYDWIAEQNSECGPPEEWDHDCGGDFRDFGDGFWGCGNDC